MNWPAVSSRIPVVELAEDRAPYPVAGRHSSERETDGAVAWTLICKIIYTTNAIKSPNFQLRKIKNRGHFPSDDAANKLLWLAIRDIEDKRARAKEVGALKPPPAKPHPGS